MMKRSLLIAFVLTLTTTNTHARFTQADAWMGIDQQPNSLNKYAYGNADPANHIDPTGHFSLIEFGAGSSIQSQMLLTLGATVSVGSIIYGTSRSKTMGNISTGSDRGWGVWDVIAGTKYRAGMASMSLNQLNDRARAEAKANVAAGTAIHGHHTIPVYLCGRPIQRISFIDSASHVALHTGLGRAKIAKSAAEEKANKMLPSLTRHQTDYTLNLADTKTGRTLIAGSIDRFYNRGGWKSRGHPTIGTVFPEEKRLFISGVTSRPLCVR